MSVIQAGAQTVAIGKGSPAKFDGFLIPVEQFRQMNQDLIEKDILKKQLEAPQVKEDHTIEGFIWGFIAGSTTILLVDRYGGK